MTFKARLGATVRAARKERGWTIRELAMHAGLSIGFLCDVERGIRGISAEKLAPICRLLRLSADALLGLQGESP